MIEVFRYYTVKELVSPDVYNLLNEQSLYVINSSILRILDDIKICLMRVFSNKNVIVMINNWHSPTLQKLAGGVFYFNGYREYHLEGLKKDEDPHRYGLAIDAMVYTRVMNGFYLPVSPKMVCDILRKETNRYKYIKLIKRYGLSKSHIHFDVIDNGSKKLEVFEDEQWTGNHKFESQQFTKKIQRQKDSMVKGTVGESKRKTKRKEFLGKDI